MELLDVPAVELDGVAATRRVDALGVALPIGSGGASPRQEMASSTTLTDLGRGTVVWSGGARTQVDGDAGAQVSALTRVTVDAMKKAGVIR